MERSDVQIETFESIEKLRYSQQNNSDSQIVKISGDLNENEKEDPRVQAMSKLSRHCKIISQKNFELPKTTFWANGNFYHSFRTNYFRDVQHLYQDKKSKDGTLNELKLSFSTCRNEIYQLLSIDTTKDDSTGSYRLGFNSVFVPDSCPFYPI